MAEPLRIKGSDGKTYLNPKADRDVFARFLDGFIQMLDGSAYGPDYNMYGKPKPQISLDENEVPVITSQESSSPVTPVTPAATQRFDNTLEGQYQRYFKTPEFDNVFGAGARGEGAPKDAAAMQALGSQLQAPSENTNIASMYAAQSAMGRVNQDAIQDYFADADLPGNVKKEGAKESPLQAWARENPMLAQRLYEKNRPRIQDNPATDTGTAVRGETPGTLEQQIEYGAGSPVSKSPTELDISPATEEEFAKEFAKTKLGKYF